MWKKLTSTALALVIVMSMVSILAPVAGASTSGDWEYSLEDGNATIEKYLGSGGAVIIPETLDGYPVMQIGNYALAENPAITSISIPNGVQILGGHAASGCANLESVTISDTVFNIGPFAFWNSPLLKSVVIPDRVTFIGDGAFFLCPSLTSIIVSSNVTFIGANAFSNTTTISCYPGSYAHTYVQENNIPFVLLAAPATYTVTFNKNASDAKGSMAKQTFSKDISKNLSANKFTRTGYTFTGWATSKTGKVAYKDKASFKTAKNVTLYAVWAKNYTVTFNKNASDAKGSMAKQTFAKDISKNLSVNKFTRTGYTFTGWATSKTGKVTYKDKAGFKTAKNVTLYAVWKKGTAPAKMTAADFKATGSDAAYIENDFIKYMTSAISEGGWDAKYAWGYQVFSRGNSDTTKTVLNTNRGIKPGYSSWKDVEKAYGGTKKTWKKSTDLIYQSAFPTATTTMAEKWNSIKTYADYDYGRYRLRFYFDAKDNVVLIAYAYNYSLIGT